MARLDWHPVAPHYEVGVSRGVLYPLLDSPMVWNGLISVSESLGAEEENSVFFDGIKQFGTRSKDELVLTVEAYTYPALLDANLGMEGFCYTTQLGLDGYRIHLIYDPAFRWDDRAFKTQMLDLEPVNLTWEVVTKPIHIDGLAPSSHIFIEFTSSTPDWLIQAIEDLVYGTDNSDPYLPYPDELIPLFQEAENAHTLLVIDHGDGSWTAIGSDDVVALGSNPTEFTITSPSAIFLDSESYTLNTL